MKFGIISDEISECFSEAIEIATKLDLDHLEPRIIDGKNIANLGIKSVRSYAEKLNENNLEVLCLSSPILKTSLSKNNGISGKFDDFRADFSLSEQRILTENIAKKANILDAKYIRIFSGWKENVKWEEKLPPVLEEIVQTLKDRGLMPLIELDHMCNITTYNDFKKLPVKLRSKLGLLFDPGNYVKAGNCDVLEEYERAKEKIHHLHVKNLKDNRWCSVKKGIIDYQEIIRRVKKDESINSLSLEPYSEELDAEKEYHLLKAMIDDSIQ